jgi:hypothetical protein
MLHDGWCLDERRSSLLSASRLTDFTSNNTRMNIFQFTVIVDNELGDQVQKKLTERGAQGGVGNTWATKHLPEDTLG